MRNSYLPAPAEMTFFKGVFEFSDGVSRSFKRYDVMPYACADSSSALLEIICLFSFLKNDFPAPRAPRIPILFLQRRQATRAERIQRLRASEKKILKLAF